MWRPYQILWPLLSLFLVRVDLTDLFPLSFEVRLLRVIDGDTVLVKYGNHIEKLRFSLIDAPEKDQHFLNSKLKAGSLSLGCTKNVLRKSSYLMTLTKYDIYGRLLGDLEKISLRLVEEGCAGLYPYAEFSNRQEKSRYLRAYNQARKNRKGLWQYSGYQQPKLWRKLNKRFSHRPKHRPIHSPKPYPPERKS